MNRSPSPAPAGSTGWQRGRLVGETPVPHSGEAFEALVNRPGLVLERIVSSASPSAQPYLAVGDEWVLLAEGRATLEIEGLTVVLAGGDYLWLPAGTAHRVVATSEGATWLALHLDLQAEP